jgi:hypothetical protein
MQTINWTAGTGARIEVSVATGFELDLQGRRKSSGRKVVIIAAKVNGKDHFCPMGLQTTNHPVAVAKLGDIGMIKANYDLVKAVVNAAELEIAAHNAGCDAHESKLDTVSAQSAAIVKAMSCGEVR